VRGKQGGPESRQPQLRRIRHIDSDQVDGLGQPLRRPGGASPLLAVQGDQCAIELLREASRRGQVGRSPDGGHEDGVNPLRLDMVTRPQQIAVRTMMI
jgi:hypothetical protein